MGIIDLEELKRKGHTYTMADFKKGPNNRERSHWIRLGYEVVYGKTPEYRVLDYTIEVFRSESLDEAVSFYNDLYLKYKG